MKIDVHALREYVEEALKELTEEQTGLTEAIQATDTFIVETKASFEGKTADASRAYLEEAYKPIQQKTLEINQLLMATLQKYLVDAEAEFGAYGIVDMAYIKQDYRRELEQMMQEENQVYRELNQLIDKVNEFVPIEPANLGQLEQLHYDMLREVSLIEAKLTDFDTKWSAEFGKVEVLQDELANMLSQVTNSKTMPTNYKAGSIHFMTVAQQTLYNQLPQEFKDAIANGFATIDDFQATDDGFIICMVPIGEEGYSDWYPYCIKNSGGEYIFGLSKLRANGEGAIGISISFISLNIEELNLIFSKKKKGNDFDYDENSSIYKSIYGVGQGNSDILNYFSNPNTKAAYLISDLYVQKIVNENYKDGKLKTNNLDGLEDYQSEKLDSLGCFVDGIIHIKDRYNLTEAEYNSILITHTANTSIYSFAAEVQAHAMGTGYSQDSFKNNGTALLGGVSGFVALPILGPLGATAGFTLTKWGLDNVQKSGVKSDSGVGESGSNPVTNKAMEEAFGRNDSFFTKEHIKIHSDEEKERHGW
ncbi:T7SS effector LXG polymorphic toxin [Listeria goaensis]|uniref:T7SS effector LXG polymorphic toxin n=1 Tax=Listeria goaensis TaxID=1649188 RepID=UPI000B5895A9|nr:T7SS effector LXG polymorphic toxin [Listeria goaensis]